MQAFKTPQCPQDYLEEGDFSWAEAMGREWLASAEPPDPKACGLVAASWLRARRADKAGVLHERNLLPKSQLLRYSLGNDILFQVVKYVVDGGFVIFILTVHHLSGFLYFYILDSWENYILSLRFICLNPNAWRPGIIVYAPSRAIGVKCWRAHDKCVFVWGLQPS